MPLLDQPTSVPITKPSAPRLLILIAGTVILVLTFAVVWLQSAKYEPLVVHVDDQNRPTNQHELHAI